MAEKYLIEDSLDECEFFNEGDLSCDGYIYCPKHGASNGKKVGLDIYAHPAPKREFNKHMKKEILIDAVLFGPALLFFIINCL